MYRYPKTLYIRVLKRVVASNYRKWLENLPQTTIQTCKNELRKKNSCRTGLTLFLWWEKWNLDGLSANNIQCQSKTLFSRQQGCKSEISGITQRKIKPSKISKDSQLNFFPFSDFFVNGGVLNGLLIRQFCNPCITFYKIVGFILVFDIVHIFLFDFNIFLIYF